MERSPSRARSPAIKLAAGAVIACRSAVAVLSLTVSSCAAAAPVVVYAPGARELEARAALAEQTAPGAPGADELRASARDDRARARALEEAEATACLDVTADDRAGSPFQNRARIARVEPYYEVTDPKGRVALAGATLALRAAPGITDAWLHRLLACHLARHALLGQDLGEAPLCPFAVSGTTFSVSSSGPLFLVTVRSQSHERAREIFRLSQQLTAERPSARGELPQGPGPRARVPETVHD